MRNPSGMSQNFNLSILNFNSTQFNEQKCQKTYQIAFSDCKENFISNLNAFRQLLIFISSRILLTHVEKNWINTVNRKWHDGTYIIAPKIVIEFSFKREYECDKKIEYTNLGELIDWQIIEYSYACSVESWNFLGLISIFWNML